MTVPRRRWAPPGRPRRGRRPAPASRRRPRGRSGGRRGPPSWTRPAWRPWSCSPRSASATPTPTSRCRRSCAGTGCATGTPALATELGYGTLRAPRPARRGDRRVHRPAADRVEPAAAGRPAAGRLPAAAHPDPGARRGGHHRRAGPGRGRAAARPGSSTRCCAGSASATSRPGSTGSRRTAQDDPLGHSGVRARPPALDRPGLRRRARRRRTGRARRGAGRRRRPARGAPARRAPARSPRPSWRWSPGASRGAVLAVRGAPGAGQRRHRRARRDPRRPGRSCRTRAASWSRWPLVRAPLTGPDGGRWLDLCAGPGGKAVLLGALAAMRRRPPWTPSRSASTGPTWCAAPSTGCRSPCTSATAGRPRCPTPATTGCWWTPRAPGWARCAAARRPAGGAARTTCPG